jgi:hypothetical protein
LTGRQIRRGSVDPLQSIEGWKEIDLYPTTDWIATINHYCGRYPAFRFTPGHYQLRGGLVLTRAVYLYGTRDVLIDMRSTPASGFLIQGANSRLEGFRMWCHASRTYNAITVAAADVSLDSLFIHNAGNGNLTHAVHGDNADRLHMTDCNMQGEIGVAPDVAQTVVYMHDNCSDCLFSGNFLGRDWNAALHRISYKAGTGCIGKNLPDVTGDSETNLANVEAR